jgi:RNA polymerase sigma factor (sigma-70 family)
LEDEESIEGMEAGGILKHASSRLAHSASGLLGFRCTTTSFIMIEVAAIAINHRIGVRIITSLRSKGRLVERDDGQLVAACLKGDESAWSDVVDRYGRLVYSIPRRYGMSEAESDDVFQGVFATLFRRLDGLRDPNRLSAWLITCAHRESWRVGKQSNRNEHLNEAIVDVSSPSENELEQWERQHIVREGLRQLGGPCEQLLTALFMQGGEQDYQTIAEQLDMPVGSIGPTRARCFKKLEPLLRRLGLNPESPREAAETE